MSTTVWVRWAALGLGASALTGIPSITIAEERGAAPHMETVQVTAQHTPTTLLAEQAIIPGGVSIIDNEELYRRQTTGLADMLRFVPGMWAVSATGTDHVFISSRGSNLDATNYDMNGIRLLQDGLPVTAADGNNHNRIIDPLSARYASVARGANAMSFGAATLGGAINFISPTARGMEGSTLYLNGGSHGTAQARLNTGTVFADERGDAMLTLESLRKDGYRRHSAQERLGLYTNAGWQLSDTIETRFYATYITNDHELASGLTADEAKANPRQAGATAVSGNFQVDVDTRRLANKTTWQLSDNSSLELGFSWEKQSLYHPIVDKVMVDFDGPGPNPPVEVFSLLINTDQRDWNTMVRYNLEAGDHQWRLGLNYGENRVKGGNYRNDGGRRNGLTTRINNSAESLELFILDHWHFAEQWTLVYGAQAVVASREVVNIDTADDAVRSPNDDYESINPRLGIIYQPSDGTTLFANISRLYEAPTNYELDDDARGDNHTLSAMRGTVVEVGGRGQHAFSSGQWHWDLSLYYARIRDAILSVDDPAAPGTSLTTNIDDTIHAGLELALGAVLLLDSAGIHRLEPQLSFTLNHFRFDSDPFYGNNDLPVAPGYSARAELLYRHSGGLFAGPTLDVVDDRYADFNNTYQVDGYALLGFRAGFEGRGWQVFCELRNLQDRDYIATHAAVNQYTPSAALFNPGEPLSAYVGVQFQL
ncbi:MAG: TonB-dependent receptor [Porticoccaceae bacterium]|nr:TonB-dependent receptor [Porticoccaceae bacterium]